MPGVIIKSCFSAFLVGLVLLSAGCSNDQPTDAPHLVRFADPTWIASYDTDHPEVLAGQRLFARTEAPFERLDKASEWYPFFSPLELDGQTFTRQDLVSRIRVTPRDQGMELKANSGIARMVPVTKAGKVHVEFTGEFDPAQPLRAFIVELPFSESFPEEPRQGDLRQLIARSGQKTVIEAGSSGKNQAACGIPLRPTTRSLLLMVANKGKENGLFNSINLTYMSPTSEALWARKARGLVHPAIHLEAMVEETVRPSLLLPPRTEIVLKETVVPDGARFRCALGVSGEPVAPLAFRLQARVAQENEPALLVHTSLDSSSQGWRELDCDLAAFAGRSLQFVLTCDTPGQGEGPVPLVFCGSPMLCVEPSAEGTPSLNLVLISLDTLRSDHLGCYGYPRPVSPAMDRFAADHILFENAYAHASYTLPSHVSLFTSLYPSAHGVENISDRIPDSLDLLAQVLADQGLCTAAYTNGGFLSHEYGYTRGFDLYCEVDPIGDRYWKRDPDNARSLADGSLGSLHRAFSWMEDKGEKPFFLFLHTFMVHEYLPPEKYFRLFNEGGKSRLQPGPNFEALQQLAGQSPDTVRDDLEFFINLYDATIRAADDMVQEVVEQVERLGLQDRTVIIITSDHGEEFLEHGQVQHTGSLYEELIHVPLILSVPGMAGGQRISHRVSQVDLLPTVLEILGMPRLDDAQGRSLGGLLEGRDLPERSILAEMALTNEIHRTSLIRGEWKYIEGDTDPRLRYPAPAEAELYCLDQDPGEEHSLIEAKAKHGRAMQEELRRMREALRQFRKEKSLERTPTDGVSPELKERLKQQGYL